MCGRVYRSRDIDVVMEAYRIGKLPNYIIEPDYNVSPHTFQPVIVQNPKTKERTVKPMFWGFVPRWSSEQNPKAPVINARRENFQKPYWEGAANDLQIGLFPCNGFYEWPAHEKGKKGKKHPQAYRRKDTENLFMPVLYEKSRDKRGEELYTFANITSEANELLLQLPHPRCPSMISGDQIEEWFDTSRGIRFDLLQTVPSDKLETWLADPAIGKTNGTDVRHDEALLHRPPELDEPPQEQQQSLFAF